MPIKTKFIRQINKQKDNKLERFDEENIKLSKR